MSGATHSSSGQHPKAFWAAVEVALYNSTRRTRSTKRSALRGAPLAASALLAFKDPTTRRIKTTLHPHPQDPSGKLPSSTCCTGRQLARILHVAWLRAQVGHQILRIYPGAMEDHELAVPSLCYLPRTGAQFTYAGTPEYRIFINGPCAKLL